MKTPSMGEALTDVDPQRLGELAYHIARACVPDLSVVPDTMEGHLMELRGLLGFDEDEDSEADDIDMGDTVRFELGGRTLTGEVDATFDGFHHGGSALMRVRVDGIAMAVPANRLTKVR